MQCLINGVEENDKMVGQNDGFNTVEEAAAIARELEAAGADSLHIRIGPCYEHITQFAGDLYFAARGLEGYNSLGTRLDFDKQFQGLIRGNNSGVGLTLDIAAKIKAAVSIPVGCATYNDPALAPDLFNAAIEDGKVDFLMMNRPLCVDPEYVNKLREGRIDEIAPCTRCLHCFFDTPFDRCNMEHCRVNAAYFRAYSDSMPKGYYPSPAETPKKVMVIGGGAQAVDTAILLLGQGKKVTLVASEAKDHFEYGHSVYMKQFLSTAFYSAGGRLFPSATVTGVGDGFLSFTAESGIAYEYPCDTVIEALDMLPNTELIEGLDNAFSVGDCEQPFNIAYAIATGNMAARKV